MRLEHDPAENRAYLHLVEGAKVAARVPVEAELPKEQWGVTLDLDAEERLVGIEFRDARARVPETLLATGAGLGLEGASLDDRPAYVYLAENIGKGAVRRTLTFGKEATRPAWGVNLDVDRDGRIIGIEML